jgi:peptidyl-prolyl cis-trans isomerase C
VNDVPIPEIAVQRGLRRLPAARRAEARPEILNYLIDNALLDQYLARQAVAVEPKEVDAKVQQVREAIQKDGSTVEKVLKELMVTEADLRAQIAAELRFEKFVNQQATEQVLRQYFDDNRDMFDGTTVRARHILLTPPSGDAKANEQAKARLQGFKKQVEEAANTGLAKLPATADNLAREQARAKLTEQTFSDLARKESACPSKAQGGDLGFFPRAGSMVEPFARAAFALKPYQMSDVVTTQFGHHLILVTERKPGKDTKFEDIKVYVKEAYADWLRTTLSARLRPSARIVIN